MEQSVLSLKNLSQMSPCIGNNRKPVMQSAVISCRNIFSLFLVHRTKHVEEQESVSHLVQLVAEISKRLVPDGPLLAPTVC